MFARLFAIFSICVCSVLSDASPHHLCDEVATLDCSTDYIPFESNEMICGTDGVTYINFCYYSQARCKTPTTHIAKIGDCSGTTPSPIVTATTQGATNPAVITTTPQLSTMVPTTTMTTKTTAGRPVVTTIDSVLQVFCQSKDAITCKPDLDPICGSDKNFYLNQCEFTKAKCDTPGLFKETIAFCTGTTVAPGGK